MILMSKSVLESGHARKPLAFAFFGDCSNFEATVSQEYLLHCCGTNLFIVIEQFPASLVWDAFLWQRFYIRNLRRQLLVTRLAQLGSHHGKGKNLLDAVVVRKEHGQSINAHTPATGGRKAVFECLEESLIDQLRLLIALVLLPCLLFETQALVERVVQLSVSVDNFLLANKSFETIDSLAL